MRPFQIDPRSDTLFRRRQRCSSDCLTDSAVHFIRQDKLDLLVKRRKFLFEDFLCLFDDEIAAQTGRHSAGDLEIANVIEIGIICDRIAEIGSDRAENILCALMTGFEDQSRDQCVVAT